MTGRHPSKTTIDWLIDSFYLHINHNVLWRLPVTVKGLSKSFKLCSLVASTILKGFTSHLSGYTMDCEGGPFSSHPARHPAGWTIWAPHVNRGKQCHVVSFSSDNTIIIDLVWMKRSMLVFVENQRPWSILIVCSFVSWRISLNLKFWKSTNLSFYYPFTISIL